MIVDWEIYTEYRTRTLGRLTETVLSEVSHSEVWNPVYDLIWLNPAVRGYMGMPGQIGACVELESR